MDDTRCTKNLLVVAAVEGYARRHGISAYETLRLFLEFGITETIRQCYETLSTQGLDECALFAEDILKRKNVCRMPQNQGGALRGETPQRGVAEDLRSKAEARGEASPLLLTPPLPSALKRGMLNT